MCIKYFSDNTIRDINNFICMCYQNINGVKSFVDNHINETPWKEWITDIIECSLILLNGDKEFRSSEYNKVFKYACILGNGR